MKQIRHIYLIILCALAWSTGAWGQYYVLTDQGDNEVNLDKSYTLNGPGALLTFNYRHQLASTNSKITVYAYTTNNATGTATKLNEYSTTKNMKPASIDLTKFDGYENFRSIKFVGSGTLSRKINHAKVTRATVLYASDVSFEPSPIGITTEKKVPVSFSNAVSPQNFSVSVSGDGFSLGRVSNSSFSGEDGSNEYFYINFNPTEAGNYTGTVTLTLGSYSKTLNISGQGTITKVDPTFTWGVPSTAYIRRTYVDFFRTDNKEIAPKFEISGDEDVAQVIEGENTYNLYFPGKKGTISIKITQESSEHYNRKEQTYTVTVEEAQNHLPATITADNRAIWIYNTQGAYSWNSGGIQVGDGGGGFNWEDKYVDIGFEGIPDKLYFDYVPTAETLGNASSIEWYVSVKREGGAWTKIWPSSEREGSAGGDVGYILIEDPQVRYVRLCYSGNYAGLFKNVRITERKYLTASPSTIDFGTRTKGSTYEQTFTISHCNAGNGVVVTSSDDDNFEVTPSVLAETGYDLIGTKDITVRYLNNNVGAHSGTITITDPNGTNASITLTLSGTTQTTYYTRAVATTDGGGSAYITYDSGSANSTTTTSTSTENSGLVTTTNASKTVYLRAVPAAGYRFVEWRKDGIQVSTTATAQKSYDYDSETSGSPTVATYTAVFEAKTLTLNPASSTDPAGVYAGTVTLSRTLPEGYSTIALPFNTTVAALTGRTNDGDWVAQLQTVTHTQVDNGTANEYTLYFQKVDGGAITANQPYVLHLAEAKANPSWTPTSGNTITVSSTASAGEKAATNGYSGYGGWVMHANYDVDLPMSGKYGIVNSAGGLMLGGLGSTLAAYTAYIAPPAQVNNAPRLRVAYVDTDGTTTVVDDLPFDNDADAQHIAIYGPDGKRRPRLQPGLNIVHQADGSVKKVMY